MLTMTAGVAEYQLLVKAGTVGSVLTSAHHFRTEDSLVVSKKKIRLKIVFLGTVQ